jgi:hypothetical protein
MPQDKIAVEPQITIGDKIVKVGPLDWAGLKQLVEAFGKADLPLPNLAGLSVRGWLDSMHRELDEAGDDPLKLARASQRSNLHIYELLVDFVGENLPALWQWLLKHPPLVAALVAGASNVTHEEMDRLTAGELLRVARASWQALAADGFFTEAVGFFGGLLGLGASGQLAPGEPSAAASTAASASESTSASAPSPVGA